MNLKNDKMAIFYKNL